MTKKGWIILLSAIFILLLIVVLFFTNWAGMKRNYKTPLYALPESSLFFYAGDDFFDHYENLEHNLFWQNLLSLSSVKKFNAQIKRVDSFIKQKPLFVKYLKDNPIILSVHRTSRFELDLLFLTQTKGKIKAEDLKVLMKVWKGGKLIEREFRGITIFEYQLSIKDTKIAYAYDNGILIISKNPLLVEEAISMWQDNKGIQKRAVLDKDYRSYSDKWFINYSQLGSLFTIFLPDNKKDLGDQLSHIATTSNYAIDYFDKGFVLRGSMKTSDTTGDFLHRFYSQKPGKMGFTKVVPDKTSLFLAFYSSNIKMYYQKYISELKIKSLYNDWIKQKKEFESKNKLQIEKDILTLFKNEFVLTLSDPFYENLSNSISIFIKCNNSDEAARIFNNYSQQNNTAERTAYSGFEINQTTMANLPGLVFGSLFQLPPEGFFIKLRDYLVFSSTLNNLERIIDAYQQGQTLVSSSEFNQISEKLASEANFFLYINPGKMPELPERFLNDYWLSGNKNKNVFSKFGTIAYQFVNNNNSFYNELIMEFSSVKSESIKKIWEIDLDTTFSVKPKIFKNHNDNSLEVMIYDDQNNLYLISKNGEILWKRKLDNKIIGDIYQIDFYNNGKLQYLFTTESHLQLIDRLGRNVANYPIRLSAKASSGIGVMGSKLDNTMRYFVGTENNYVFGYSVSGKPLGGWSPNRVSGKLMYPLNTFKQGIRTYIFGITDKGYLYIWDTKGIQAVKPFNIKQHITNPPLVRAGIDKNDTYVILQDSSGNTYYCYLNGRIEMQSFGKFSKSTFIDLLDINNDKENELLFLDNTILNVFSKEGKALFSQTFDNTSSFRPEYFSMKDKFYISFVNSESGHLYLYEMNGSIERSYPVYANTPFLYSDLNKDGIPDLIGGVDNKLFLSRY